MESKQDVSKLFDLEIDFLFKRHAYRFFKNGKIKLLSSQADIRADIIEGFPTECADIVYKDLVHYITLTFIDYRWYNFIGATKGVHHYHNGDVSFRFKDNELYSAFYQSMEEAQRAYDKEINS